MDVYMTMIHIDLFVNSMDNMLDFYVNGLGMEIVDDTVIKGDIVRYVSNNQYDAYRVVLLQLTKYGTMIELIEYIGDKNPGDMRVSPTTITFLVLSLESKMKQLADENIFPSSSIFKVDFPNKGKSTLVFYEDPEKNCIEFLQMDYDGVGNN